MATGKSSTAVYLLCFHSEKPASFDGSKSQFLAVERAIAEGLWPYDNGDDPSFHVANKGGCLTWGVCRQEVRNSIPIGSIAVFFSFSSLQNERVLYRLCAVTSVIDKVDVRAVHIGDRLALFRDVYINALIRPDTNGWRYDESDRPVSQRHKDWLWRISDHSGIKKDAFDIKYKQIRRSEFIPESFLANGYVKLASNYLLFASREPDAYISTNPPEVAIARRGAHERWSDATLRSLTVGTAARFLKSKRSYLRVVNKSGRNVHRHICFMMPSEKAFEWRDQLIRALKAATGRGQSGMEHVRSTATARCSD